MSERIFTDPGESNDPQQKSLDLLHEAQALALDGEVEKARSKIEESLSLARSATDKEWIEYLEATIAYIDGDLDSLRSHIPNAGKNEEVLSRLADGLEKRGNPDYNEDYNS